MKFSVLGRGWAAVRGVGRGRGTVRTVTSAALPPNVIPSVQLNDGSSHPMLGYGTYKVGYIPPSASSAASGGDSGASGGGAVSAEQCVSDALAEGYRFFDCAQFYGNEGAVGAALESAGVAREDVYLASKCWSDAIYAGPEAVREQLIKTLSLLRTPYLDLYLVHWPVPGKHVEAYLELQRCKKEGLVRSIGVSNYAVEDCEELVNDPRLNTLPSINQIELNPFLYRPRTLAYMAKCDIKVQAYRALRDGKAFQDPTVVDIAHKHSKTAAQIMGRWCVQKGAIYIPKSTKRARIAENARVFDFELDCDDVARLDALTTPEAIATFKELYERCVVRDTPLPLDHPGIKRHITAD